MSEVEKMYRTIFGEFAPNCNLCAKLINCKIINNTHNCNKFECDYKRLFTAEKQIELIKWLSQYTYRNYIKFRFDICGLWYCECNMSNSDMHHTFEEALAETINKVWQDLTEEEQQQVKGILE